MKKFFRYLKECSLEMKKVAWPTKTQILSWTKIVLIVTIVFAVLLWLVDMALFEGVSLIF